MSQNIFDNEEFFNSYKELRENKDNYNELVEQPAIKISTSQAKKQEDS